MITTTAPTPAARYLQPGWITRNVFNRLMQRLTKIGVSVHGSRVLHVRGRRSGQWHSVPVNPLTIDGERFLVAPRGNAQWVRNLRVAGSGELQLGRRREPFTAIEVVDGATKVEILRRYLRIWKMEVGMFFDGVDADSTDDELLAIAGGYPVFSVTATASAGR